MSRALWDLMRASGFVAYGLLTVTLCLGIANVTRWQAGRWTRAAVALVHRNVSLVAVVFLGVHIATAVTDTYVHIPALAVVIPAVSHYDPVWIALGALSVDLMIAVVVTSLLRARLGRRAWKAVHWVAYLAWPTALLHAVGSGAGSGVDTGHLWSTAIYAATAVAVALAVAARRALAGQPTPLPETATSWRAA